MDKKIEQKCNKLVFLEKKRLSGSNVTEETKELGLNKSSSKRKK